MHRCALALVAIVLALGALVAFGCVRPPHAGARAAQHRGRVTCPPARRPVVRRAPARAAVPARQRMARPLPHRGGEREAEEEEEGGEIRATGAYQREYWYWYMRSLPAGFIPAGAEAQARARARGFRAQVLQAAAAGRWRPAAPGVLTDAWTELGPRGLTHASGPGRAAGRNSCIMLQKAQYRILVGSASGGIWKRALGAGQQFTPQTDAATNLSIGCLAADPNNAQVLYAGT